MLHVSGGVIGRPENRSGRKETTMKTSENVESRRVVRRAIRRVERALDVSDASPEEAVIDMMADLMHWCQRREVDFEAAMEAADRHFAEEGGFHHRGT
jgi:hypothetical protein